MTTLVYTDSTKKSQRLRDVLGGDIAVREIPLPLYRIKEVVVGDNGFPRMESVPKKIADVRDQASRYPLVLVILPPVAFWHDVAWSLHKALAGLSCTVRYYFPHDLVSGFDSDALELPPPSLSSLTYAFDTLYSKTARLVFESFSSLPVIVAAKHLLRRTSLTALSVFGADYLSKASSKASFDLVVPNLRSPFVVSSTTDIPDSCEVHLTAGAPTEDWHDFDAPLLLSRDTLVPTLLLRLPSLSADRVITSLEALYDSACISYFDIDSPVPDAVHTWATETLLNDLDVSVDHISTSPNLSAGVYATGAACPHGTSPDALDIYAIIRQRTLLAYCTRTSVQIYVDSIQFEHLGSCSSTEVRHSSPDYHDWWHISDYEEAAAFPPVEIPATFDADLLYRSICRLSLHEYVTAATGLGLSSREALSALHYLSVNRVIGYDVRSRSYYLVPAGYVIYRALLHAAPSLMSSDLNTLAVSYDCSPASWLERASSVFAQVLIQAESACFDIRDITPSTDVGIVLDPITMLFAQGDDRFAAVLHDGVLVPVNLGAQVQYACPACGNSVGQIVLDPGFSARVACTAPSCTESTPLTLVPSITLES